MFRAFIAVFVLLVAGAAAEDVVHLNPRGTVKGNITSIDSTVLRIRVTLAGGVGSSEQRILLTRVKLIDFGALTGEPELLAEGAGASKIALTELWAQKKPYIDRPNSNAGEVGLLLGEVLLASPEAVDHANARNLYTIIERDDWNLDRRAEAKRGRLEALVQSGAAAEAMEEARAIAEEGGDPRLLLRAEYVIASSELQRLRELISENPKWREDDHTRPEITALYNSLLDQFLKPLLFYGTEEEAATDGLLAAGEVYYLIDLPERARECFNDVALLYPKSEALIEAEAFLKRLSTDDDDDKKKTDPEN